jgi:hypothetical protein
MVWRLRSNGADGSGTFSSILSVFPLRSGFSKHLFAGHTTALAFVYEWMLVDDVCTGPGVGALLIVAQEPRVATGLIHHTVTEEMVMFSFVL